MHKNYHQTIKYLESLKNISHKDYMQNRHQDGKFFLLRMQEFINKLNINLKQFKFIHIGGTSGKGTTTAMVHNILCQDNKKVGSYYSPHPTTTIERIKMGKKFISPNNFVKIFNKLRPVIKDMENNSKYGAPSYFEILLAIALKYFENKQCDYVILEVGCGGEFDATNIIPTPKICAITNIGLDHTHLLGKTLIKIATTKAGIIKNNSKFITTEKRPHILKIFKKICQQKKAKFIPLNSNPSNVIENNILLATKITEKLGVKKEIIKRGIKQTSLSCRFEIIQKNPLVILDGAHNLDKIKSTFNNLKNINFDKLYLIFTLNDNKDIKKIIKYIAHEVYPERQRQEEPKDPVVNQTNIKTNQILKSHYKNNTEIILTKHLVDERECADLKMMQKLFQTTFGQINNNEAPLKRVRNFNIKIINDPHQALNQILKKARQNDLILITGSFYLAGELRKKWISEEKILEVNN